MVGKQSLTELQPPALWVCIHEHPGVYVGSENGYGATVLRTGEEQALCVIQECHTAGGIPGHERPTPMNELLTAEASKRS